MANALYASCAEVLSLCQTLKDDLPAILDPETGFAPRLRRVCHEQLEEFEQTPASGGMSQEELDVLKLEANTWGLLQAIMPPRKVEALPMPSPRDLLAQNPFTPTSTLAQAIMNTSPLLTELVVVREWLQEIAPSPQHPEATTGYWKFTKHSIMQTLRSAGGQRDGLVKEMDPDVVNKGDGRALASDDANYEKSLANALYTYVRAGRLSEAIELCRKAHQPWRAASIRGSRLFQWKAIANEVSEDDDEVEETDAWQGNRRRRLWKSTCVRAALNSALPQSERVLFSALAPSPQTSTILKSACRTWEDHLWAQLSIVCEEKESMEMALLANKSFWEGGEVTDDSSSTIEIDREQEEEEWEKEVVGTLEGLKSVAVFEGQPADHAFHVSQLHIILDRTSILLEIFANGLTDGIYADTSSEYSTMCRFFAHLCLFLQMIDIPVPPLATQVILEAYIRVLEGAGQRDLIAMYAGALGDNAIERYALFLTSLALSTDLSERRLALTRGMDHGLDLDRVAIATAERTIEKAFELLPPLAGPLPSIIAMQPPASETEQLLLRSIEWTTFSNATFHTALEQANVILRYFLGSGRVNVAQQLLGMLPPELAAIGEPEEMATEYLHYQQFFAIWEALERVVECESLESPQMNRETKSAWLKDYAGLIDTAHEKILKLLTSEWLVSDVDVITNDRRRRGLVRIRQLYIPELIIRLHHILVTSRHKIPGYVFYARFQIDEVLDALTTLHSNAKLALKLANTVADSRYKLYDDFVGEGGIPLSEYLGAVRQAIIGGLEGGGSDPLRLLTR